jgi:hypothetical protein
MNLQDLFGGHAYDFTDRDEAVQFYLDHVWGHFGVKGVTLPAVVGICGPIGAGKSTAAKALYHALGYSRASMAETLKHLCASIYTRIGAEKRHFFGSQDDKAEPIPALGGTTGRRILQLVGTEGFRAAFGNTWPALAFANVADFLEAGGRCVFEDVRFENEAASIRERGGVIIQLSVLGEAAPSSSHASEAGVPEALVNGTAAAKRGDVAGLQASMIQAVLQATYNRQRAEGTTAAGATPGLN